MTSFAREIKRLPCPGQSVKCAPVHWHVAPTETLPVDLLEQVRFERLLEEPRFQVIKRQGEVLWGKWLENDLRKKGIDATPLTQRVGWMSCLLMLSIHCDETVEQKVKGALILLGFEFMDSNVVDAVQI